MSYALEKYHGRASRHQCPNCGREQCFSLYLDENGNPFDKIVGRCNHENSCGYDYQPPQFFADHPERKPADDWRKPIQSAPFPRTQGNKGNLPQIAPNCTIAPKAFDTIPLDIVNKSLSVKNNFVQFLCGLFDRYTLESPTIIRLIQEYGIGSTKDGKTIFWQIDKDFKVRTGKVIKYDPESGHRDKSTPPNWAHSIMKQNKLLPETFELSQCLYGEHLLTRYPKKRVALVEAEKTAVIASAVYPDYVWLAVGSVQNLSAKENSNGLRMLQVLRGRDVVIFPDVDGYQRWRDAANNLTFCNCIVSDYLQRNATETDIANKIDIADILIRDLRKAPTKPKTTLEIMIERNPALQYLIDTFELKAA